MHDQLKSYTIKVTVVTVTLFIVGELLANYAPQLFSFKMFPLVLVLFYTTSLLLFYLVSRIYKSKPKRFIPMYTLVSGMKLLFYSCSLLLFLFFYRSDSIAVALTFVICYISFTFVEIFCVLSSLSE